jgi:serine/threonine protein kinase
MISSKNSSANKGGTDSHEGRAQSMPDLVPDEMLFSPAGRTYQVLKYLSQGNFGVVWLVQEVHTGELRAMKMPLRYKDLKAFKAEVELHSSLVSPYVVEFIEAFDLRGWPVRPLHHSAFLVCERSVGYTTHASRAPRPTPLPQSAVIHL